MACIEGKAEQGMYLCSQCYVVVSVKGDNQILPKCPCCESEVFLSKDGIEYHAEQQTIPDNRFSQRY
ncbi:hypothetical protein CSW98_01900 [Vibrio sp. HA2012]|uniref:hypothetical protein n=1 Tax=Vibrio sp. HA2012 TaxID=1971595 RepID=UPI000C2C3CF5|nr:hypothetical protein [Vibrio sp. HA2012]PJC87900.1 hypothetical protein CSW98_01900 [Vibrio sp. HA2012]